MPNYPEYAAVNIYDFYETFGEHTVSVQIDTMTSDGQKMAGRKYDTDIYIKKH